MIPDTHDPCELSFQKRSQWFAVSFVVIGFAGVVLGDHYNYREVLNFALMVGGAGVQMMTGHLFNQKQQNVGGGSGNTTIVNPPTAPPLDPNNNKPIEP